MDRFATGIRGIIALVMLVGGLLAQEFRFPYREELAGEVAFWKQIFTRYSQNQFVLHDSEYPYIQYKVITFDRDISRRQQERILRQEKRRISELLNHIHTFQQTPWLLSAEEKSIMKQFEAIKEPNKFLAAARRVRAQQGIREQFKAGVERSFAYLPYIKKVFRMYGLPEEVGYLPHMESSFNPRAVSHVRAVGMWQFMRSTARHFMRVNRIRDERWDPFISTHAAARLLKRNYQALQDWGLAITAYNYGLAGLKRAVRRFGRDYIKIRKNYLSRRFGFASRNFYPEFLAVVEIVDSLSKYFPDLQPHEPLRFHEILLPAPVKLPQVIQALRLPLEEIRSLNPAYRTRAWSGQVTVPAGYPLRLPESVDAPAVLAYIQLQNPDYVRRAQRTSRKPNQISPLPIAYQLPDQPEISGLTLWQQLSRDVSSTRTSPLRASRVNRVHTPDVEQTPLLPVTPLSSEFIAFLEDTRRLYETADTGPLWAGVQPSPELLIAHLPGKYSVASPVHPPQVVKNTERNNKLLAWAAYIQQTQTPLLAENQRVSRPMVDSGNRLPDSPEPNLRQSLWAYQEYINHTQTYPVALTKSKAPPHQLQLSKKDKVPLWADVQVPEGLIRTVLGGPNSEYAIGVTGALSTPMRTEVSGGGQIISRRMFIQRMRQALSVDAHQQIVVFQGETLEHLANWLGVRVGDIRRWNQLSSSRLQVGQLLKIHFVNTTAASFLQQRFRYHWQALPLSFRHARQFWLRSYSLRSGETLSLLAARHSEITVNILLYFNEFHKLHRLQKGETINFIEIIK